MERTRDLSGQQMRMLRRIAEGETRNPGNLTTTYSLVTRGLVEAVKHGTFPHAFMTYRVTDDGAALLRRTSIDAAVSARARAIGEDFAEREEYTAAMNDAYPEPRLGSDAWKRERAARGIRALEESDADVVREVLEALAEERPDSDILDALARVQRMRDDVERNRAYFASVPPYESPRAEATVETFDRVLDVLQALAHGAEPAQGSADS